MNQISGNFVRGWEPTAACISTDKTPVYLISIILDILRFNMTLFDLLSCQFNETIFFFFVNIAYTFNRDEYWRHFNIRRSPCPQEIVTSITLPGQRFPPYQMDSLDHSQFQKPLSSYARPIDKLTNFTT